MHLSESKDKVNRHPKTKIMQSNILSTSFVIFCILLQTHGKRMEIKEEIESHLICKGVKIEISGDMMIQFAEAANQCVMFEDEHCFKSCVAHKYNGTVKDNLLDMEFLRRESKKLNIPDSDTQKRFDQLLDALENCAKPIGPISPPEVTDTVCEKAEKLDMCIENKFKEVCM